jgi:hypothetical protein
MADDRQFIGLRQGDRIALIDGFTIDDRAASGNLEPVISIGTDGHGDRRAGGQNRGIEVQILMDGDGVIAAIAGGEEAELALLAVVGKGFLLIAGGDAGLLRDDPDLQQMGGAVGGGIEFAVGDAGSGTQTLDVAGIDRGAIAHAVFVGDRAGQDVGNDFHILVGMGAKALARRNVIFIDHAQTAEAHVGRVMVTAKGKAVMGLEPAAIGLAPIG